MWWPPNCCASSTTNYAFRRQHPDLPFVPQVHLNHAETVLPMRDGLTKLRDFPTSLEGPGETVPGQTTRDFSGSCSHVPLGLGRLSGHIRPKGSWSWIMRGDDCAPAWF